MLSLRLSSYTLEDIGKLWCSPKCMSETHSKTWLSEAIGCSGKSLGLALHNRQGELGDEVAVGGRGELDGVLDDASEAVADALGGAAGGAGAETPERRPA